MLPSVAKKAANVCAKLEKMQQSSTLKLAFLVSVAIYINQNQCCQLSQKWSEKQEIMQQCFATESISKKWNIGSNRGSDAEKMKSSKKQEE